MRSNFLTGCAGIRSGYWPKAAARRQPRPLKKGIRGLWSNGTEAIRYLDWGNRRGLEGTSRGEDQCFEISHYAEATQGAESSGQTLSKLEQTVNHLDRAIGESSFEEGDSAPPMWSNARCQLAKRVEPIELGPLAPPAQGLLIFIGEDVLEHVAHADNPSAFRVAIARALLCWPCSWLRVHSLPRSAQSDPLARLLGGPVPCGPDRQPGRPFA